jgi:tetratricopeptide (TPR) repeat protein
MDFKRILLTNVTTILVAVFCPGVHAQSTKFEPLKKNFAEGSSSDHLLEVYGKIADEYFEKGHFDTALSYVEHMFSIPNLTKCDSADLFRMKGIILTRLSMDDKILQCVRSGLEILKGQDCELEEASLLNLLGIHHVYRGEYVEAVPVHYRTLEIFSRRDSTKVYVPLSNIGVLYFKLRDYENALRYYLVADSLRPDGEVVRKVNIATCYFYMNELEKGKHFLQSAIQEVRLNNGSERIIVDCYFAAGIYNLKLRNLKAAKASFLLSSKYAEQFGNNRFLAEDLVYLSRVYQQQRLLDSSYYVLKRAAQIAREYEYNEILLDVYRQFAKTAGMEGKVRKALLYKDLFIKQKDRLHDVNISKSLALAEAHLLDKRFRKKIADQDKLIRARSVAIAMQNKFVFVMVLLSALLGITIVLLAQNVRSKKRLSGRLSLIILQREKFIGRDQALSLNEYEKLSEVTFQIDKLLKSR